MDLLDCCFRIGWNILSLYLVQIDILNTSHWTNVNFSDNQYFIWVSHNCDTMAMTVWICREYNFELVVDTHISVVVCPNCNKIMECLRIYQTLLNYFQNLKILFVRYIYSEDLSSQNNSHGIVMHKIPSLTSTISSSIRRAWSWIKFWWID